MILNLVLVVKELLIAATLRAGKTHVPAMAAAQKPAPWRRFPRVRPPRAASPLGDLPRAGPVHRRGLPPPGLPPVSPVAPQAEARPVEVITAETARRVRVGAQGAVTVPPDVGPSVPPTVAAPRPAPTPFRAAHVFRKHLLCLILKRTGRLCHEDLRYLRRP